MTRSSRLDVARGARLEAVAEMLRGRPRLRGLHIGERACLAALSALPDPQHLRELDISEMSGCAITRDWDTPLTGAEIEPLCALTSLRTLRIGLNRLESDALLQLACLRRLERLGLGGCIWPAPQLGFLPAMGDTLLSLWLDPGALSVDQVVHLGGLRAIRELDLGAVAVGSDGVRCVSQLTTLERLVLRDPGLTDDDVAELARLAGLRELWLGGRRVGDAGVRALCAVPELTELSLDHVRITSAGIGALARLPRLRRLALTRVKTVDEHWAAALGALSQLHVLNLRGTVLSARTVRGLRTALPTVRVESR